MLRRWQPELRGKTGSALERGRFFFSSPTPHRMVLRLDGLSLELPKPKNPSANDTAAVQELLGSRFREVSTLMNYAFQSFNFWGHDRLRPFYVLVSAITAEEYSHIEVVSHAINLLRRHYPARYQPRTKAPSWRREHPQHAPLHRQRPSSLTH